MTETDRFHREQEFKESFERQLPEFAEICRQTVAEVIFHQAAFADYQETEFCLLGRAIKHAGLLGKTVRVTGRNAQTLRNGPMLGDRPK